MRRFFAVLLVVALVVVPGCESKEAVARAKASSRVREGDRLVAAKSYDKAIEAYADAARQLPAGEPREAALRKASYALAVKVAGQPLPVQVTETHAFLGRLKTGLLPLSAHNWLSERLIDGGKKVLVESRTVWLAGARSLSTQVQPTPAKSTKSKRKSSSTRKTTSSKKKRSSSTVKTSAVRSAAPRLLLVANRTKSARSSSATSPARPGTTPSRSAAVAPVAPAAVATAALLPIRRTGPSPAQLQSIARTLPALGQPPAMAKLYVALATLSIETAKADAARVNFARVGPTRSSIASLRSAETRLVRAISAAEALLAEVD